MTTTTTAAKSSTYNKAYYEANKDRIKVTQKAYRDANPEKIQEIQRLWRAANEGHTYLSSDGYVKYIGYTHPAAAPCGVTNHHRIVLWDKLNGQDVPCNWCGKDLKWNTDDYHTRLVTDHVNTVKNDNRPENLVPSCQHCNLSRPGGQNRPNRITGPCEGPECDNDAVSRLSESGLLVCKVHYMQNWYGNELTPRRKYRKNVFRSETHKECTKCEEVKELGDFFYRYGKPKGACKACEIERTNKARQRRLAAGTPCSNGACEKPADIKGLCSTHYSQSWHEGGAK